MSKAWTNRLAKLSEAHKAGKIIWYRRAYFTDPNHSSKEPKWHIFKDRKLVKEDKFSFDWEAKCGYMHIFSEYMFEEYPRVRTSKPPIKAQCLRCNKKETA